MQAVATAAASSSQLDNSAMLANNATSDVNKLNVTNDTTTTTATTTSTKDDDHEKQCGDDINVDSVLGHSVIMTASSTNRLKTSSSSPVMMNVNNNPKSITSGLGKCIGDQFSKASLNNTGYYDYCYGQQLPTDNLF